MKSLVLLALLLTSCDNNKKSVSIYPVREPFEYVLTASDNSFNSLLIQEMNKTCKNKSFVITEAKKGAGFIIVYFNCKVGN